MVNGIPARRLIDISNLGRQFGTDPPVNALADVNLVVEKGDWLAISGPSGSGKSTLLNIIGCLDSQTSGKYLFDGVDVASLSDGERAGLRGGRIGFVFQAFHLLAHRSVLENVMLAETYQKRSSRGRPDRAMAALEQVGLGHRSTFLPTQLSGGERQRVAIARALMCAPTLLLCDEPTGNLDSQATANILELFEALHATGQTVIVITHEEDVARRAGHRVRVVDGTIVGNA